MGALRNLIHKWLDVSEVMESPSADFTGVIHQAGKPLEYDSRWRLVIDMGSVGLDALNELLSVFQSIGAELIEIGGES